METPSGYTSDRVGSALAGTNPTVLRRMRAGFAVIGDRQHLPGYCVLITDRPDADQLHDLPPPEQQLFLADMAVLGRAVATVCARRDPGFRRINLEIQGNTDAFLHAHITPRYDWEPPEIVGWPAALHHWVGRSDAASALGPQHDDLRADLVAELDRQLDASPDPAAALAAPPRPFRAVIFDFHQTLSHLGAPRDWLDQVWAGLGRAGSPREVWGGQIHEDRLTFLSQVWSHARTLDPNGLRDLSTAAHRDVWHRTTTQLGGFDDDLAMALYDSIAGQWRLYDDVLEVIGELRAHGIRLAVLSNIGLDIRPMLARSGVLDLLDAVVLSFEVGCTKPDPAIFTHTVRCLGVDPGDILMVGDTWHDDGAAAQIGIRTLLLPPTLGPRRGLDLVTRLVGRAHQLR